ncbi:MAG: diguanylate cyclase [Dehalococcoidales bacterium]|nr:diguanylate cyclase [Dehalococcoidales bacterium]
MPLLITTAVSRPWQRRHTLFILFLASAILWSIFDIILRADFYPESRFFFFQCIIVSFILMAVQLHVFTSSYFPKGTGRWLPFAYGSLAAVIVSVILGWLPENVVGVDGNTAVNYGKGIIIVTVPLLVIVARNLFVFIKMLKKLENPVLYNQVVTLIFSICVLTVFTLAGFLPMGEVFPIPHYGSLINAFILSYAVIRHKLVDIRLVIRRGTAWVILGVSAMAIYGGILTAAVHIFNLQMDNYGIIAATVLALICIGITFFMRARVYHLLTRVFQGASYQVQEKLQKFTDGIHNVFSLQEQGGELLSLLADAINVKQVCLLFPEIDTGDLVAKFCESRDETNQLGDFRIRSNNPIIKYLEKEKKYLTKENLAVLPAFLNLWPQEREEIESKSISMFVPLISRDRLIAVLVLGEKRSGRYSLEELSVLENVTSRVAVSLEKEYLREQLREREEELSVINNSSVILASSLDIQEIFGNFIEELKKVVEITWATIVLIDEEEFVCIALSAPETSAYQIGDRVPMERTGTAWVVSQKRPFIEHDLAQERYFTTSDFFYKNGLRSTAYLPLIAKGKIIGSFILGSKVPHAFGQRHVRLLEQLASQIAMPLENSQLYARAEKKARIDELTGLFNRRSLDEMLDSEISRHSRYGGTFSLAILDLDGLKSYNDTYGHLAGDSLLKTVGVNIKAALRNSDFAFRYGGDEFGLLLPQTEIDDALMVLERVRKRIGDGVDAGKMKVTASIGVACWPDDGISHTDIIAAADVTLYRAKRGGRNQTLCASGPLSGLETTGETSPDGDSLDSKLSGIINSFAELVDSRSYYTSKHSKKVANYSVALAKVLEMSKEEIRKIETCAMLHDVGKMAISSDILNKTGELTDKEWEIMKKHSAQGANLVKQIPQLTYCVEPILHHHENYDGSGYPNGLKGEEIPLISRILAIANSFAVITSDRSYSEAITHENAIKEIKKRSGTYYDPYLVERFASIFEIKEKANEKKAKKANGQSDAKSSE